ncbi:MAG: carboxylesterase family protein [Deltaproteobacteria bacterium]|nr:carboxylesterase family protein [Deltaproteobacteria bacterium]
MRHAWLVVLAIGCGDGGETNDGLTVAIDSGTIHGVEQGATRAFLGVPYAAPPVGALRWKRPQPVAPWDRLETIATGIQCPQAFSLAGPGGDEDCLTLNVWAPAGATVKDLPVMVWFHGGAFVFGSGGDAYYNGSHLAETYGVVVVTVNYRLGAFGFLAHPALAAEDPAYPSSGNYGLEDQFAALGWVQRNIAAFGGDPARVLMFGESAGGYSACVHYVAPRTQGLFAWAISQSGLCSSNVLEPSRADAEAAGIAVAEGKLGCTGAGALACLRGKSTEQLLDATKLPPASEQPPGGFVYSSALATLPNVDGVVIPKPLRELFAEGNYEKRPLLLGTNRDEGTLFHSSFFATEVTGEPELRAALAQRFAPAQVDAIVARYPIASFPSANAAIAKVTGDAFFVCPARRTARAASAAGAHVYRYSFEQEPGQAFLGGLGVFHSAELPFVFGTDPAYPLARVGEAGQPVAGALQRYWTRFAAAGDPNGPIGNGDPPWPAYSAAGDRHLTFATPITSESGLAADACDFWDAL